jgi:DNA-binding PadR family transcriptional regulator
MAIKQGLLALLAQGPMYGYQLRTEFESRTGATWPLNVGQVYTTLGRLERDGLVEVQPGSEHGSEPQVHYAITDAGRAAVASWFTTPVGRGTPPRDELAIKLALAITVPGVDVGRVVQTQRTATVRALQDYTRLKARPTHGNGDLAWQLVLDSLIFSAEAEVRWLDHCEGRLARSAAHRGERPQQPVTDETPATQGSQR